MIIINYEVRMKFHVRISIFSELINKSTEVHMTTKLKSM